MIDGLTAVQVDAPSACVWVLLGLDYGTPAPAARRLEPPQDVLSSSGDGPRPSDPVHAANRNWLEGTGLAVATSADALPAYLE